MSDALDTIRTHPRLVGAGRTEREQQRLGDFARDVAGWLYGEPAESLGPLARVVVRVARRELSDPMRLCQGRALLAVEAGARAVQVLWPLVRDTFPDEPERPEGDDHEDEPERGEGGADEGRDEREGDNDNDNDNDNDHEDEDEDEDGGDTEHGEDSASADGDDGEGGTSGSGADEGSEGELAGEQPPDGPEEPEGAEQPEAPEPQGPEQPEQAEPSQPTEPLEKAAAPARTPAPQPSSSAGSGPRPTTATELDFAAMEAALRSALGGEALSTAASEACGGALEAERVARHLERFLPGIGWSSAPGQLDHALLQRLEGLSRLLQRLPTLQDLADRLGRLEDANRRSGDQIGGGEEVAGVHFGGEVALALPGELALLGDPSTEDLFYQRLLERRLLSLELTGRGMDGASQGDRRGPVIAAIDTSGSMQGAPELAAKALVLAVCRRVLPQGRAVHLLLFGGAGEHSEIRLKRGLGGLEGLVEFLSLAFQAGTDFDTPLLRALELLRERDLQRADLLVVTDGLCRATADIVAQVAAARAERGVRVLSVVLGHHGAGGVEPFSDEVWQLDPADPSAAVGFFRSMAPTRR